MNKISKILLGIILIITVFGLSAFGMYKYNEIKVFNNLADQGKQYMIQKDYDKAIQIFQQALNYKNDSNIKRNIALAQNLKNEENKKGIISKNIQLANDAAKNNKYDEANKYLDEILKIDSNNSDAKNLKDIFAKAVQDQQEKAKAREQANTKTNTSNMNDYKYIHQTTEYIIQHGGFTYNQALAKVKENYPRCIIRPIREVESKEDFDIIVPENMKTGTYIFHLTNNANKYVVVIRQLTGDMIEIVH